MASGDPVDSQRTKRGITVIDRDSDDDSDDEDVCDSGSGCFVGKDCISGTIDVVHTFAANCKSLRSFAIVGCTVGLRCVVHRVRGVGLAEFAESFGVCDVTNDVQYDIFAEWDPHGDFWTV